MYFLIMVKKYIALATTKIYCQREHYMYGRRFSDLEFTNRDLMKAMNERQL